MLQSILINWQCDGKGHPIGPRVIRNSNGAIMLLDQTFTYSQSQAGSLGLGGEKRFENALHGFIVYSFASVSNGDLY